MPPFTGSNVPLEEDILRKTGRPDFFTTWLEWAGQNFEQIIRSSTTGNSTQILFSVPANRTLFITEAFVSVTASNNTNASASVFVPITSETIIGVTARLSQNDSNALNFRKPIKVESGQDVSLVSSGNATGLVNAGFSGFLIDKKIS